MIRVPVTGGLFPMVIVWKVACGPVTNPDSEYSILFYFILYSISLISFSWNRFVVFVNILVWLIDIAFYDIALHHDLIWFDLMMEQLSSDVYHLIVVHVANIVDRLESLNCPLFVCLVSFCLSHTCFLTSFSLRTRITITCDKWERSYASMFPHKL